MKNIKYISWGAAVVVVAWLVFGYFNFMGTSANPDYICVKSVDRTCQINESNCGEWDTTTWTRTCEWTRVTKVAYYHTRTSCEKGYSKEKSWKTGSDKTAARFADQASLDTEWKLANSKHPSSGRHSTDFVYWTENCQIQQVDTERPGWEVEQVNINTWNWENQ